MRWLAVVLVLAALWVRGGPPPPRVEVPARTVVCVVHGLSGSPVRRLEVEAACPVEVVGNEVLLSPQGAVNVTVGAPYFESRTVTVERGQTRLVRLLPASPID